MENISLSSFCSAYANGYNADNYTGQKQIKHVINVQGKKMIEFTSGHGKAERNMGNAPLPPVCNAGQHTWYN